MSPPHALFVSHAAERTGPPIYLLTLLRWLRANTDVAVTTAFQLGGVLHDDFAALGDTVLLHGDEPFETPVVDASAFDLVYYNASWAVRSRSAFDRPRAVVTHVHEMEDVVRFLLSDEDRAYLGASDRILVGCGAAARNLVDNHGMDAGRIVNVPYPLDPAPLGVGVEEARRLARAELDLPADLPVLVGAGVFDWRKAPDLLLHVAWHLRRAGRRCGVVWIGDDSDRSSWCDWDEEAKRLGLADVARRVPSTPRYAALMAAADVFVLSSREDTFPLVCVEAASMGIPTVCFDDAGIVELIEERDGESAGACAPYPDLAAMAAAIDGLLADAAGLAAAGRAARRRFETRHRTEVAMPLVYEALRPLLDRSGTSGGSAA